MSEILFYSPDDLKPHNKALSLIPPLERDDLEVLERDIAQHDVRVPLAITPEKTILDGCHRWRIARKLRLPILPCQVFRFASEEEAEEFIITVNLARRHLTTAQKAVLGLALLKIESRTYAVL